MNDEIEIEITGDAVGATRVSDIDTMRAAIKSEGIRYGELVNIRKAEGSASEALGVFKLVVEHGKDLAPILIAYIAGRMGRKIAVTVDGTTITAGSKREIEDLIPVVNNLRKKARSKKKG